MKRKHEYEAAIAALQNRLIACESAAKRILIAHDNWIDAGQDFTVTSNAEYFFDRLDDLYTLAGLNNRPAFELSPSPDS